MRYLRLIASYQLKEPVHFGQNPVNTLRGALGYQLKKMVCFQRARDVAYCHGCFGEKNCIYALCFETSYLHADSAKKFGSGFESPHLLTLDALCCSLKQFNAGDCFSIGCNLFGRAVEAFPYVVNSLIEIGKKGIGRNRAKAELLSVNQDNADGQLIFSSETQTLSPVTYKTITLDCPTNFTGEKSQITLEFLTPTSFRVNDNGKISNEPEFSRVVGSILRRYSVFESTENVELNWDFKNLIAKARQITIKSGNLELSKWRRISSRQKQAIIMGGVTGTVTYEGDLKPFVPILEAGTIIRVGKGTTFGQGCFKLKV